MICVQYGPITIAVRSTTRTPASGPECPFGCGSAPLTITGSFPLDHGEAAPQGLGVPIGHDGKEQGRVDIPDSIQVLANLLDRPRRTEDSRRFGDRGPGHPA